MNAFFQFKNFRVYHDRCAMKVGTDGVLLGAWSPISKSKHVLDIGCGSGLISLMVAQRSQAIIVGVEIDDDAASQAVENVALSPWASRINIVKSDICQFISSAPFDTILVNPPFYEEDLLPPDAARARARHASELTFAALLRQVNRLLTSDGHLYVIIPTTARESFLTEAIACDFFLNQQTIVITRPQKSAKRLLCSFSHIATPLSEDTLLLMDRNGKRSHQYEELTKDFYIC